MDGSNPGSDPGAELRCSFCAKPASLVRRLIAGNGGVAICDTCIRTCHQIVKSDSDTSRVRSGEPIAWSSGEATSLGVDPRPTPEQQRDDKD